MKSERAGYPPLFLRSGAATQTLTAIAAFEPASVEEIQRLNPFSGAQTSLTTKRLVAQGLIRRYYRRRSGRLIEITLDRRHPQYGPIRALLGVIAAMNGIEIPPERPVLPAEDEAFPEVAKTTTARLFKRAPAPGTWRTLLGPPKRSLILLLLGLLEELDATTICRIARIREAGQRYEYLDPMEADGLIVRKSLASFPMYSLAAAPWTEAFRRLAQAIADTDDDLPTIVAAAKTLMLSGGSNLRKNLRAPLGLDGPFPKRKRLPGREADVGE